MPAWLTQDGFDVRFEWGAAGLLALAGSVQTVVIVDVLRFTTAVDAALSRGAAVLPHAADADGPLEAFARGHNAHLADGSTAAGYSLSPASLLTLQPSELVVLPSPNGSTCAVLAAAAGVTNVLAACLRNASAVASWLSQRDGAVAVIACGERWPDGSLRPAIEDALGAGAVLAQLAGARSPEAELAVAAWTALGPNLARLIETSASSLELQARGLGADVAFATAHDVSSLVPVMRDGAFRAAG